MKVTHLVSLLSAVSSVYGAGLLEVLRANGFNQYASGLEANDELLCQFENRNDITIYAVPDAAFSSFQRKGKLHRRQTQAALYAMAASKPSTPPGKKGSKVGNKKRSLVDSPTRFENSPHEKRSNGHHEKRTNSNPDSNYNTIYTFLDDPQYVNLGPGEPLRFVTFYTDPPPGQSFASLTVSSGGGTVTNQTAGPFKFDNGLIYGFSGFPDAPATLLTTLESSSLSKFRSALLAANLGNLNDYPGITVFAPQDSAINGPIDVRDFILQDTLGLSPDLFSERDFTNLNGRPVTITFEDGSLHFNGIRIITRDLITKNGVIQVLESTEPRDVEPCQCGGDDDDNGEGSGGKGNGHGGKGNGYGGKGNGHGDKENGHGGKGNSHGEKGGKGNHNGDGKGY